MKLIPHHQDDKHGTREYRSPDGAAERIERGDDNGDGVQHLGGTAALGREAGAGRRKKLNRLAHLHGRPGVRGGQPGKRPRSGTRRSWRWKQVMRWRSEVLRFAPDRLAEFDELIADGLNNPASVQKADQ